MIFKAADILKIVNDKIKMTYIVSFSLLGIFAYFLLFKYDIGNFYRLNSVYQETNKNLQTLKRAAEYKSYTGQFNSRLAIEKGPNWLMEAIGAAATSEGVALELVRPIETRLVSGYKVIRVMAEGKATYADILHLLSRLEGYEKYLFVEEFSLLAEGTPPQVLSRRPTMAREMAIGEQGSPLPPGAPPMGKVPGVGGMPSAGTRQDLSPATERTAKFRISIAAFGTEK